MISWGSHPPPPAPGLAAIFSTYSSGGAPYEWVHGAGLRGAGARYGRGFVPNPEATGMSMGIEVAAAWVHEHHAEVVAVGRSAVARLRDGVVEPLHRIVVVIDRSPNDQG